MKYLILGLVIFHVLLHLDLKAQPKWGHISFGLIRYEILDTTGFAENQFNEAKQIQFAKRFSKEYEFDLYFNKNKAYYIRDDGDVTWKAIYNMKSQVLYSYWDAPEAKDDSTKGHIWSLTKIISTMDSAKQLIGFVDNPDNRKDIFGFDCFKVQYTPYDYGPVKAHAFVTSDLPIPSAVLFNVGVFREKWLPMEYTFPIGKSMLLVVGAIKFSHKKPKRKIFKLNLDGFEEKYY